MPHIPPPPAPAPTSPLGRTVVAGSRRPDGPARALAVKAPDGTATRYRVVLADPDPLARRVVRDALQEDTAFVVTAEASDGVEAVELAHHYRPDIVLIESALPRLDGIAATTRIHKRAPDVRVVMFSVHTDVDQEMNAVRAGAIGFVAKTEGTDAAVRAMETVMRGEAAISSGMTMRLVERARESPDAGHGLRPVRSTLTTREWEVLDLLSTGAATGAIAERLVLSEDTVYSHVKNVMRKLGVHTRDEAIVAAHGLMGPSAAGSRT